MPQTFEIQKPAAPKKPDSRRAYPSFDERSIGPEAIFQVECNVQLEMPDTDPRWSTAPSRACWRTERSDWKRSVQRLECSLGDEDGSWKHCLMRAVEVRGPSVCSADSAGTQRLACGSGILLVGLVRGCRLGAKSSAGWQQAASDGRRLEEEYATQVGVANWIAM